jgi:hypothetical protein
VGLQEKVVRRQIQAYGIVQDKIIPALGRSEGIKKFSYIEEFLKNKNLQDLREDPTFESWFVDKVIKGKFSRGEEVRNLHKIAKNERAKEALATKGHKAAMKVLAKKDPTIGSVVFRKIQVATEALNNLGANSDEAQKFKSDPKAQKMLRELLGAVQAVAKMSKMSLTG